MKVWVDLRSRDGQIFALIGLLEGSNNRHVFTPADQSVIFGGFEISTKVTTIGELPRLTKSSSAPKGSGPDRGPQR